MKLLGLDCSLYIGWALFKGPAALPYCRTWKAPQIIWRSDDYAPHFLAVEDWLTDMLVTHQPDVVAFESPVLMGRRDGRGSDENNIRRLIGIVSVIELVVARRNRDFNLGVRCVEIHNSTAKAFMGLARGKNKDGMIAAATARGFSVADQHQADAAAVGLVAYDHLGF
jgi:predicted nuclease with RNAse H fold